MTYWILVCSELGPKVTLVPEVEGRGKAVVRLLESDDLEPADVIHAVKFARGTGPEGSASDTDFAHFLDNVRKSVLNLREGTSVRNYMSRSQPVSLTSIAPSGAPGNSNAHLIWNPCETESCAKTTIAQILSVASRA